MLAIMLRSNSNITGIKIGQITSLLAMFADDMSVFMLNSPRNWQELRKTIREFQSISGLKVNYEKSTIYRLGSAKKADARYYASNQMIWTDKSVNILGVMLDTNVDNMLAINIEPIFERMNIILQMWKMRDLSLLGKILVVNTL